MYKKLKKITKISSVYPRNTATNMRLLTDLVQIVNEPRSQEKKTFENEQGWASLRYLPAKGRVKRSIEAIHRILACSRHSPKHFPSVSFTPLSSNLISDL